MSAINRNAAWQSIKKGSFLYSRPLALILWFGLTAYACVFRFILGVDFNNFQVFRHVFFHVTAQQNLYLYYPTEYNDVCLYGPIFSALIAPFAVLQLNVGVICWVFFNAGFLFYAIDKLPVSKLIRNAVLIISSVEMMNNAAWSQINPFIAGCIILGFVYTDKGKEMQALFFIMLAGFIKIYGFAGLAFFFFSDNKPKYIMWMIIWAVIFFCMPMLWSSPSFIIKSYQDWYHGLVDKSGIDTYAASRGNTQDICVQGMVRRIFNQPDFNSAFVVIPAMLLFAAQYLRWNHFSDPRFRVYLLCSALIFTVIFSIGSEAPTYMIAVPAVCLWYFIQQKSRSINIVFIIAVFITIFGYSDLLTPYFRKQIMIPYALKALPCFVIWLMIVYGIFTKQFLKAQLNNTQAA